MSHYGVLVALPKGTKDIESALAKVMEPFDENLEVGPYISETVDDIIKLKATRIEHIKEQLAKSKKLTNARDLLWEKETKERLKEIEDMSDEEWYHEQTEDRILDEKGNVISTYNPDSKWDWYVIGGRWEGCIPLKNGKTSNQTKVKNVRITPTPSEITAAKKLYEEYQKMATTNDQSKKSIGFIFSDFDTNQSEEDFVKQTTSFGFYAFLDKEGEWHQRAECGSWGTESDVTEDMYSWMTKFVERFISPLDSDDILVMVDCHI